MSNFIPKPLIRCRQKLADFIRETPNGQVADSILRKCVHCGFLLRYVSDIPVAWQ